ncbi:hypothetical protein [Actinomadura violacea]|uniref:Uncharacterized protein n=1 Tax=Actinomadura violacea TaxID=2819934 RepID=A0ABS3S9Y0_9ACTN|nr:hypothetical protein [Actinomadura violacea]MBO2465817.1 hypothetical protein [Actinomadura violacea]
MNSTKHRMALMVWCAVLPTLTGLQLLLGHVLLNVPPYLRPPIMATLTVPIVIYLLLPLFERLRRALSGKRSPVNGSAPT